MSTTYMVIWLFRYIHFCLPTCSDVWFRKCHLTHFYPSLKFTPIWPAADKSNSLLPFYHSPFSSQIPKQNPALVCFGVIMVLSFPWWQPGFPTWLNLPTSSLNCSQSYQTSSNLTSTGHSSFTWLYALNPLISSGCLLGHKFPFHKPQPKYNFLGTYI
jgi:hypothetical protein